MLLNHRGDSCLIGWHSRASFHSRVKRRHSLVVDGEALMSANKTEDGLNESGAIVWPEKKKITILLHFLLSPQEGGVVHKFDSGENQGVLKSKKPNEGKCHRGREASDVRVLNTFPSCHVRKCVGGSQNYSVICLNSLIPVCDLMVLWKHWDEMVLKLSSWQWKLQKHITGCQTRK